MEVIGRYWQHDQPEKRLLSTIGTAPKRWGRMDPASRIAIVEVGFLLGKKQLLNEDKRLPGKVKAGLIVGTRRGSLFTDLEFCRGLAEDSETASPLLFSYTLPNIPLTEAANQYLIKGPVYSIYSDDPFSSAVEEGKRWLKNDASISFIIAGELDFYCDNNDTKNPNISANFTLIE